MKRILVLSGPNLNLLGTREPQHYGTSHTLDDIHQALCHKAEQHQVILDAKQSQSESRLIELIHEAYYDKTDFIIFNPAAYTHTSIALRDALLATQIPFIEVHLSNPLSRESFRHTSYFSDIAVGTISGFGANSYFLALDATLNQLNSN